MNKKFISLALTFAAGLAVGHAQIARVSTPEPILRGQESAMYNPVLSNDGRTILFSDVDHTNLRSYDIEAGVVSPVKASAIEAMTAQFDKAGNVRFTSPVVEAKGSTIVINGKTYSPVPSHAGYTWESVSPDGTKVMFFAAGVGIIITDLNGNIIARPGNYEAPVWFGNDYIVAQNATDDGHQYHSSQIVLLNLDGSKIQALTKPESMTFSPAASAEAGKVVYSTIDGRLYQMNLEIINE
ncbi:MAG: hypothetical protein K2K84_08060 [Muribaculaceae bacterium]|nr:hypothetical protein [Muribaculaceae bacterium]